jgi:hypothetical protein
MTSVQLYGCGMTSHGKSGETLEGCQAHMIATAGRVVDVRKGFVRIGQTFGPTKYLDSRVVDFPSKDLSDKDMSCLVESHIDQLGILVGIPMLIALGQEKMGVTAVVSLRLLADPSFVERDWWDEDRIAEHHGCFPLEDMTV